jgi:DNA-binding SARP family transcriptional activator|tara:strand:+ start:21 stop:452 length:432 start_codon:yes stop_codon:yes gene_type:complete
MNRFFKITILITFIISFFGISFSAENYFSEGVKLFKNKKYEDAKFLLERSIVYDPKHANSYLYLAKIYNEQEDQKNEEKNLEATILIDPTNEEAILMLMEIGVKNTDYSKIKKLSERFSKVCTKLCEKNKKILKDLKNLEPKK